MFMRAARAAGRRADKAATTTSPTALPSIIPCSPATRTASGTGSMRPGGIQVRPSWLIAHASAKRSTDAQHRAEAAEHDALADEHRADAAAPQANGAQRADLGRALDHRHAHRVA